MREASSKVGSKATRFAGLACCALLLAGCQQEMAQQPSYRPQQTSPFFPDGLASRPQVPGTVAQGGYRSEDPLLVYRDSQRQHIADAGFLVGLGAQNPLPLAAFAQGEPRALDVLDYTDTFPFPVEMKDLERGRERYTIFCAVCHDPTGNGKGKIVERSYTKPPSYITDRSRGLARRGTAVLLRDAPAGYYFEVITKGYGAMADYSAQVPPRDRWAIIAYIRALQLSQHAPLDGLSPDEKQRLQAPEAKP